MSLATEIHQADNWLSAHHASPPTQTEWSARISTLKEAAEAAGMLSIRKALDSLHQADPKNHPDKSASIHPRARNLLRRLADTLNALALTPKNATLLARDRLDQISAGLNQYDKLIRQNTTLLSQSYQMVQKAMVCKSHQEQQTHLGNLGNLIQNALDQQDYLADALQETKRHLNMIFNNMSNEIFSATTTALRPHLDQCNRLSPPGHERPHTSVETEPDASDIFVPKSQIKPIVRICNQIFIWISKSSAYQPASIRLAPRSVDSIFELRFQCGPKRTNSVFHPPHAVQQDLRALRARLLFQAHISKGFELTLQWPNQCEPLEAIPVECPAGPILVPKSILKEAYALHAAPAKDIQIIDIEPADPPTRHTESTQQPKYGLIIYVGDWKACLAVYSLQYPRIITLVNPNPHDPDWVMARSIEKPDQRPIFHPLGYLPLRANQSSLYP